MEKIDRIELDWHGISEYIRDSIEYTFIDKAVVVPGIECHSKKLASTQDWYFKIHFEGNPIMPGVLVMEIIQQTGGLIINTMPGRKDAKLLFHGCESMRMFREVRPGDVVEAEAKMTSFRRGVAKFEGKAEVDGQPVCKMLFTLVVEGEIPKPVQEMK